MTELIKSIESKHNEILERIKSRTPECPLGDGKGKFVRLAGWRGSAIYECPNGHKFSMYGEERQLLK